MHHDNLVSWAIAKTPSSYWKAYDAHENVIEDLKEKAMTGPTIDKQRSSTWRARTLFFLWVLVGSLLSTPASTSDFILIKDINLLEYREGRYQVLVDHDILLLSNKIYSTGRNISISGDHKVLDGRGLFASPGLIDMHVHVWDESELASYLKHGVLTVRNMSGLQYHLDLANEIDIGAVIGPKLFTTSPILNGYGPNSQVNHYIVENAETATRAVQKFHSQGYKVLKVYSNLSREAFEAIAEQANALGMELTGHTPEGFRKRSAHSKTAFEIQFHDALNHKFRTIEHVESIVWHSLNGEQTLAGFELVARKISASGVFVTPTLIAHDNLVRVAGSNGKYLHRPEHFLVNPFIREVERNLYQFWSQQDPQHETRKAKLYLEAVKILFENGVPLTAGSDAGVFTNAPGASLIDELLLLRKAGLSNSEVLKVATINAAKALARSNQLGVIQEGYEANLVLTTSNPLEDLNAFRNIRHVILSGKILDIESLTEHRVDDNLSYNRTKRRIMTELESYPKPGSD